MAFVNEVISQEDWKKYDLETIKKRLNIRGGFTDQWTIDRQKDIWFREYRFWSDKENFGAEICTYWDFYWKGSFIPLRTETVKKIPPSKNNGIYYVHLKILKIEIPENIQQYKSEIYKDLKEAFEVSQVGIGIYIKDDTDPCKINLEYEGELI
ncbi:MAG: hypothetical protein LBB59_03600 [Campylobacteraceae bacterium]|jgi:hypothetical protein|nr:hypothetical protein [Campylobacteraceae bacterium]